MINRLTFFGILAFWVTMNVLLWRAEFGARGGDTPVPYQLVWRKILTAPDASSLSVYQNHERMGYAEFSTGVGQSMATLDEDKVPPEGLVKHAGYQIHLAGNVAVGDFTNRLKFDGKVFFNNAREWREFTFKITSRTAIVDLTSTATNGFVHVRVDGEGGRLEKDIAFSDLEDPGALFRAFAGNFADVLLGSIDLPVFSADEEARQIVWDARRTRVKIGTEYVPVYRLETTVLGHVVTVDVSTLGEILRLDLPDGISARIDEWSKP
jgi:hypothetical protein